MSNLIANLAKRNIHITLVGGTDLNVTAPDKTWEKGLEDYIRSYKQELVNELIGDKNLLIGQEDVKNTEPRPPATTATTATNGINSADPFATSLLQAATRHPVSDTGNIVNSHSNFDYWLAELKQCATKEIVFSLLDDFRPLSWSDDERATMSRAYHQRLNQFHRR